MSTHLSPTLPPLRSPAAIIAESFGVSEPPDHLQHVQRPGGLALAELQLDCRATEPSLPMGHGESFHVAVLLCDVAHELWLGDRPLGRRTGLAGETYIVDQRRDPRTVLYGPSHFIHFSLPLASLNRAASEIDRASISDLRSELPGGSNDPVMRNLAEGARAALSGRHPLSGLLLDGLLSSACAHVIGRYGERSASQASSPTRLAPWQERRAKELMKANLDVSLAELARECRISTAHFGRAFRNTTGVSPHQWLIACRIDLAEQMLRDPDIPLVEVALACGFGNQSHFSIAFKARNGSSPGRWRRDNRSDAAPIGPVGRTLPVHTSGQASGAMPAF